MFEVTRVALLGVFLFCLSAIPADAVAAQGGGEKAVQYDFAKTRHLLAEWAGRERFPDTVTLAYYYVYSQLALGEKVSKEVKEKIIAALRSCQRQDGGLGANPKVALSSTVMDTYYTYKTLKLLNALDVIDWKRAGAFLKARAGKDGGFSNKPGDKESNVVSTCWAVEVLAATKQLDPAVAEKARAYLLSFKEKGRGFSMIKGKPSSPKATGLCVRALALLKGLSPEIKKEVASYLKTTRYSGLIKGKKYSTYPYVEHLYYVLDAMKLVGGLDEFDQKAILDFLHRLYIPVNGGFGPRPGLGTTPPSTCHALKCLALLGKLKDPER